MVVGEGTDEVRGKEVKVRESDMNLVERER